MHPEYYREKASLSPTLLLTNRCTVEWQTAIRREVKDPYLLAFHLITANVSM